MYKIYVIAISVLILNHLLKLNLWQVGADLLTSVVSVTYNWIRKLSRALLALPGQIHKDLTQGSKNVETSPIPGWIMVILGLVGLTLFLWVK